MKTLEIYSWNINGIRAAARKGLTQWIKSAQPDILCLQETKAQPNDFPPEISRCNGYNFYSASAQKKGYAGVAVLTKAKPLQVIGKIGIKKFDNEGRLLCLEFEKFYLVNAYFPNSQRELKRLSFKQEFNAAYLKFIKSLQDKPLILTGDFNVAHKPIDLKNPKQNEKNAGFTIEERKFIDRLLKEGFIDAFRFLHPKEVKYTWWTYRFHAREKGIGWRIDYFFVSKSIAPKIIKAEILDEAQGSDHCPVMIRIKL